jgi:hypothetical protein
MEKVKQKLNKKEKTINWTNKNQKELTLVRTARNIQKYCTRTRMLTVPSDKEDCSVQQ